MRPAPLSPALLGLVCLLACDTSPPSRPHPVVSSYAGMHRIASADKSTRLGSTDTLAKADEQPLTTATFSYDFWMDTTEVTLALYATLMGRLPAEYARAAHVDGSAPVCYVSWYDAALFCNSRSRNEGLDTVYRYARIDSLTTGRVYRLVGLSSNLQADGYRLPTEAEWGFAARAGHASVFLWGDSADAALASRSAWYAANSGDSAHGVSLLAANGLGLFDMAGNAFEWVHDLKAPYPGDTVTDFLGGLQSAGDLRPVKGGSFAHGLGELRPACRADVYETTSATANRYIGFRCAAGVVATGTYATPAGPVPPPNPVRLDAPDLAPALGGACAKVAFVNRTGSARTLCYVDYCQAAPQVCQFTDVRNVCVPAISPDGFWVAFGTANEGLATGSAVYVRRLNPQGDSLSRVVDEPAFVPRWWVDTLARDTFIVYTTSAIPDDNPAWPAGETRMVPVSGGKAVGPSQLVEAAGSYHGGLSYGGSYCATGLTYLRMKDRTGGEMRTLFTAPWNGKPAGDTSQACNASISPDSALRDQVMFLDFGSPSVSDLTHDAYAVHQYLFVAEFSRRVLRWYHSPQGFEAWDHPEWSNVYDYAAASVQQGGVHPAVFLVNLADSAYTRIASGTDLWQPALWVRPTGSSAGLAVDSAGRYNEPPINTGQSILALKMRGFWAMHDSLDVVYVGDSHAANGVDPRYFTGLHGFNMSANATGLLTSRRMVEDYILTQCPRVRLVGMSLPMRDLCVPNGDNTWDMGMGQARGYLYDRSHSFWQQGVPAGFVPQVLSQPVPAVANPAASDYDSLGLARMPCSGWGVPDTVTGAATLQWTVADTRYQANLATIQALASELAGRGIHLLMVNFPQHPGYANTRFYGYWGPSQATGADVVADMRLLEQSNAYFHFYDAHDFGRHDYVDGEAFDHNHLCEVGARKLSVRLDSLMHGILDR
jgi:uncharacterized protein (TIGR02171 family)